MKHKLSNTLLSFSRLKAIGVLIINNRLIAGEAHVFESGGSVLYYNVYWKKVLKLHP